MAFFQGFVIASLGNLPGGKEWNHQSVRRKIEDADGTWTNKITDDVKVLITTEKAVKDKNPKVVLAHQNANCAIVTIEWLKQCLASKAFESTDLYEISWPSEGGKHTKVSHHAKKRIGDVSSDSENPDENEEDRAKRRQRRREAKILDVPVDGIKWQRTHHVYIEQAGYPLDAHLIFVNESGAVPYKFVRLQLLELINEPDDPEKEKYYCWHRTGTTETEEAGVALGTGTLADALKEFAQNFKSYTGLGWLERHLAPVKDKYSYVEQNYAALSLEKESTKPIPTTTKMTKLAVKGTQGLDSISSFLYPQPVETLMSLIFDENNLEALKAKLTSYDFNKPGLEKLCYRPRIMKKGKNLVELDASEMNEEDETKPKSKKDDMYGPSIISKALEILGLLERKVHNLQLDQEKPKIPSAVQPKLLQKIADDEAKQKAKKQSRSVFKKQSDIEEKPEAASEEGLHRDSEAEPTKEGQAKKGKSVRKGKRKAEPVELEEEIEEEPSIRSKAGKAKRKEGPIASRHEKEKGSVKQPVVQKAYTIKGLSEEYYKLIPRIPKVGPLIDNMDIIKKEVGFLKLLHDYSLAQLVLQDAKIAQRGNSRKPNQQSDRPTSRWLLSAANIQGLIVLHQNSSEYKGLVEYFMGSLTPEQKANYKIQHIFRLVRKDEEARHVKDLSGYLGTMYGLRLLLWATHPSAFDLVRLPAVFRDGLVDYRPGPNSLYNFGSGIYLSDLAQAALHELRANGTTRPESGNIGLFLLCEAEIGVPHMELSSLSDNSHPLLPEGEIVPVWDIQRVCERKGIWTVKGLGRTGPQGSHTKKETLPTSGLGQESVKGTWKKADTLNGKFIGIDNTVAEFPDVSDGKPPGPTGFSGAEFPYNQYVVYNESQVRLRYLFQVEMSPVDSLPVQSETLTPSPTSSSPSDVPLRSFPEVDVPPTRRKLFSNRTPGGNVSASLANLENITPEGVESKASAEPKISDKPEATAETSHLGPQPLTEINANARKLDTKADTTGKLVLNEDVIAVDTEQKGTASPPRAAAAQHKAAPKITSAAMSALENDANVGTDNSNAVPAPRVATQKPKRTKASKTQSTTASKLAVGKGPITNDETEEVKSAPMQGSAPAVEETISAIARQVDATKPETMKQPTVKKTREIVSKAKASMISQPPSDVGDLNREDQTAVPVPETAATKHVRKPAAKAPSTSVPQILQDVAKVDGEPSVGKHKRANIKSKPNVTFKEPATEESKAGAGSLVEAAVPTWQEKAKRATRTKANSAKDKAEEQIEDPILVNSADTDTNTEIEAPPSAAKKRPTTRAAPKPVTKTKAATKSKTLKIAFREHPQEEDEGDASEYDNPAPAKQGFRRSKVRESEDEEEDGDVSDFEVLAPRKRSTRARPKTTHTTESKGKAKQQDNNPNATETEATIAKKRGSRAKTTTVSRIDSEGQVLQQEEDGHLTVFGTEADAGPAPKKRTTTRATRTKTTTASRFKATDDAKDITESDTKLQPPAPQKRAITHSKTAVSSKFKSQSQAKAIPMTEAETEAETLPLKKRASTRAKAAAVLKPKPKEDSGDVIESEVGVQSLAPKKRTRANAAKATATTKSKVKGKVTDNEQGVDADETEIEAPPFKKRATIRAKIAAAKANDPGKTEVEAPAPAPAPAPGPAPKVPTGRVKRSKSVTAKGQNV